MPISGTERSSPAHTYMHVAKHLIKDHGDEKKAISLKEKLAIITKKEVEAGEKQSQVCQPLGLAKTTVRTIWTSREEEKE